MRTSGLIILGILTACAPAADLRDGGETYHVYFLGGQSNMEGYGKVWELSGSPAMRHEEIRIFVGNPAGDDDTDGGSGRWAALRAGYGHKFYVSGNRNQYSRAFGPELTFGLEMRQLNPNRNVAIIKYARGATSLAPGIGGSGAWQSESSSRADGNQLDHAVRAIRTALATPDIDNDGRRDTLIPAGLVWMQGEADAQSESAARAYEDNLRRVVGRLRIEMGNPALPLVIGKITDSGMDEDGLVMDHIALVQAAQARMVASDSCAVYVTETDAYEHSDDRWHYRSEGFLKLGKAFARAMSGLSVDCLTQASSPE